MSSEPKEPLKLPKALGVAGGAVLLALVGNAGYRQFADGSVDRHIDRLERRIEWLEHDLRGGHIEHGTFDTVGDSIGPPDVEIPKDTKEKK